jgi:hypothetical protein
MNEELQHLDTLKDIKQMMERSSRFISLSGLSGVAAGICALAGSWFAYAILIKNSFTGSTRTSVAQTDSRAVGSVVNIREYMGSSLFQIAVFVLIAALFFGFLFTYLRSRKTGVPIWGTTARRLLINMAVPMIAGGVYLLKLIDYGNYGLIAPGCLLFYGLSLLNASRYTLGEIRYLGYAEMLLGLINLWFVGKGLLFWAIGFGVLHIVYGAAMWWKYERTDGVK